MNGEILITSSNLVVQTNNCSEKKTYDRIKTASSIASAFFVGTIVLSHSVGGTVVPECNFIGSSCIRYIDVQQEKGMADLYTNKAIDLMKIENLNKIRKISFFEDDWNGTGGSAFSPNAIVATI